MDRQLSAATAVAAGDRIAVGTHALVVEAAPLPAAARLDGQGGLLLNREAPPGAFLPGRQGGGSGAQPPRTAADCRG